MEKATSTSPMVKKINGKLMHLTRRFLGNLFPENCLEKNELHAYLKGHEKYAYKKDDQGGQIFYTVRQEYFYQ